MKGQKSHGKGENLRKKPQEGGWNDWGRNDWGKSNDWSDGPSNKQDNAKTTEQQEDKAECGKRKKKSGRHAIACDRN